MIHSFIWLVTSFLILTYRNCFVNLEICFPLILITNCQNFFDKNSFLLCVCEVWFVTQLTVLYQNIAQLTRMSCLLLYCQSHIKSQLPTPNQPASGRESCSQESIQQINPPSTPPPAEYTKSFPADHNQCEQITK